MKNHMYILQRQQVEQSYLGIIHQIMMIIRVLNCPAERQQLNTERSARCPEPPPAAAGSQAQYQLQLSPQFKE